MTLPHTIGSPVDLQSERCIYINSHAKHPINERLERKIRDAGGKALIEWSYEESTMFPPLDYDDLPA